MLMGAGAKAAADAARAMIAAADFMVSVFVFEEDLFVKLR